MRRFSRLHIFACVLLVALPMRNPCVAMLENVQVHTWAERGRPPGSWDTRTRMRRLEGETVRRAKSVLGDVPPASDDGEGCR
ncbi:hypothetical protein B0H16DRAFT_1635675 [Mycena metata]|uniref:Secreted protein n=1 Tax=Mycena metata TaxID=1033252 RepID=A0AAD7M8P5_9AGAR|nr:hypothetical protein B0H16DRAFT_1635675 [Mycena metata]